jgi:hypothetical protein
MKVMNPIVPIVRRIAIAAAVGGVLVALAPGPAHAASPQCEQFAHVQTYHTGEGFFRGPAWFYGRTVTVAYSGETCSITNSPTGHFSRSTTGTADVFAGRNLAGKAIDSRPFSSNEVWDDMKPTDVWPSHWWKCTEGRVNYTWTIPGVYNFGVRGYKGTWRWWQAAYGGLSATSSFNACN